MVEDVEVYYAVRKDVLHMNKTMAYTVRSGNVSSAEGTLWSIVKGVEFRAAKTSLIDYHTEQSRLSAAFLKCVLFGPIRKQATMEANDRECNFNKRLSLCHGSKT